MSGAEQWARLSDDLLSGLVHALNNRVTALSGCAELSAVGDAEALADGLLSGELSRLRSIVGLLGLLPMRRREAEALELAPVVDDAIALHEHRPRTHRVRCIAMRRGTLQPVRVPRWALLRAIIVLVEVATREADQAHSDQTTLTLEGDEATVRLRVQARGDAGPYASEMAARCGGTLSRDGEELVLTLPSLRSLREQERAGRPLR
jgi:hypothetical protein